MCWFRKAVDAALAGLMTVRSTKDGGGISPRSTPCFDVLQDRTRSIHTDTDFAAFDRMETIELGALNELASLTTASTIALPENLNHWGDFGHLQKTPARLPDRTEDGVFT